jgi:mannose-1-phosphate guanylyltransferase/phosphomannomutase
MKRMPRKPQAVFLDRDGVINEEVDLLHRVSDLRLVPGAARAVRQLNRAGIPAIVVTNQPVVARNLCSEEELGEIHAALEELLLREAGARLDGLYYCPHHPETHHPDGNPAYRIPCACRKPDTGMLLDAARDFGLDLARCILIGDSTRDVETGRRAGTYTILVKTGYGGRDGRFPARPDRSFRDLEEAVTAILDEGRPA